MNYPQPLLPLTSSQDTSSATWWMQTSTWTDYGTKIDSTLLSKEAVSASAIWGAGSSTTTITTSTTASLEVPSTPLGSVLDSSLTSAMILSLVCLYSYILYRFRRDISLCLKSVGNISDMLILMEGQSVDFVYFLRSAVGMAICGISIMAMGWIGPLTPNIDSSLILAMALASFLAIILYRVVILSLIRWISTRHDVFREISFINRLDIAFMALFCTPIALIAGLSGELFTVAIVVLTVFVLYHLYTLYKYFAASGFSKLQLILYLCTVEILPVSYVIALAIKTV